MRFVCRCISTRLSFTFTYFINIFFFCAGKSQRGKLVNWVEKASFKKIQRLLEISERERHHEILLTAQNLRELSRSPSAYIIPIIPRPLPAKIVEGEQYVIVDLLNLAPGSSSPAKTSEIEAVGRELVISMDKKIADFGRFLGEKSDFGGAGKDIGMEKSEEKKSAKNRRFFR